MDQLIGVAANIPKTKFRNDDAFVDRLSHRFTVGIIVVFAVLVSTVQYIGKPITCWVPAHFEDSHEAYTNSYCWVKNTYFLPFSDKIPKDHEEEKRATLTYYQWIPFLLLCQAVCFYLPCTIWRAMNSKSGVDASNIVDSAATFQRMDKLENREKTLEFMTKQIDRFLDTRAQHKSSFTVSMKHMLSRTICRCCGKKFGNFLVVLYLMVKVLYIINLLAQLFVLNHVLGGPYNTYGFDMLSALSNQHDWAEEPLFFPRVTMCDFSVRRLGNVHRYTVQCVLPINLYTEKLYLFLWFWMIFLTLITCTDFLTWLFRSVFYRDRYNYVRNHLVTFSGLNNPTDDSKVKVFLDNYMRADGVFLVRLIAHNVNRITATEILCSLFEYWRSKQGRNDGYEQDDDQDGEETSFTKNENYR